ncbi:MAG: pyridoxamine 5'-phosphate oxidase [Myxococcaceae bacterium]
MQNDPFQRFSELFEKARATIKGRDFNAMTIASVDGHGRPSARIVLLKGFDEKGFVFYTNLQSRKGRELLGQRRASLVFWWPEIEHQVRIDGTVSQVSDEEADAYFASRARGSQIGAWASKQSETLDSREELDARVAEFEKKFDGKQVPRPPHWSGLRITPLLIEFWKNEPSRLHQRLIFERDSEAQPWRTRQAYP